MYVKCYTRDGVERKPEDTIVPDHICQALYEMAKRIRERRIKEELELRDKTA